MKYIKLFLFGKSFSYILDLEERCLKANFAPYDDRVKCGDRNFVWDVHTIKIAEDWLKEYHPLL